MKRGEFTRRVHELGAQGMPPGEIALALGRNANTVRAILSAGRKAGLAIPKHHAGRRRFRDPAARAEAHALLGRMADDGRTQREIAARLGVSQGYVQRELAKAR